MANSTVRGNTTTKELKKGVSIMKKWMIVVTLIVTALCFVGCSKVPTEDTTTANNITTGAATVNTTTEDATVASAPTENTTVATDPPVVPATLAEILASAPVVDDQSMLCFPGTKWGATPNAVKDVLGLSEEQILADKPFGDGYILSVTGIPFFGSEVVCGEFKFSARNDEYGLATITLYYPDDTDMAAVKEALVDIYGIPNDGEGFNRYKVSNGAVESYSDGGYSADFDKEETFVTGWWESTAKRTDVLPTEVREAMIESGYLTYYVERLDPTDPSSRELTLEYLENDPAVFLYCTNGSSTGNLGSPYYTKNVVSFDALEYIIQLLYNSK